MTARTTTREEQPERMGGATAREGKAPPEATTAAASAKGSSSGAVSSISGAHNNRKADHPTNREGATTRLMEREGGDGNEADDKRGRSWPRGQGKQQLGKKQRRRGRQQQRCAEQPPGLTVRPADGKGRGGRRILSRGSAGRKRRTELEKSRRRRSLNSGGGLYPGGGLNDGDVDPKSRSKAAVAVHRRPRSSGKRARTQEEGGESSGRRELGVEEPRRRGWRADARGAQGEGARGRNPGRRRRELGGRAR